VDEEKKQARDKAREAKANLAAGLQQVDLQIRQAYSNLTASRKLMDGLERSVGLARRTLQTVTEKYQVNVLSRAELLEARTNLMRATVNRDRVSAAVLKTRALLFRLMGRLEPAIFQAGSSSPLAESGGAEHRAAMARGER
jgi:outer membrane protein TolC